MKKKNYSSDKAINYKNEDKFQRYEFAKRIADTIEMREDKDCIVIGIYGAWGEGKTSIINFIDARLGEKENIIPFKFNPWRYGDEQYLLMQFFNQLASILDTKLKNNSEEIGGLLKKYGSIIGFGVKLFSYGTVSVNAKEAAKALDTDIEVLKSRIGEIIDKSNQRIVVFIDDIDRLDKSEIYSVFRLVKLNADFSNLVYVLSFDDNMVASAIGNRFGAGNQESGYRFLT